MNKTNTSGFDKKKKVANRDTEEKPSFPRCLSQLD